MASMRKEGFLYVISEGPDTKFFKIGITTNPDRKIRLRQLQTGNPRKLYVDKFLRVTNYKLCENFIHACFAKQRRQGEWFEFENLDELEEYLQKLDGFIMK